MVWVETKEKLLEEVSRLLGTKIDTTPIQTMSIDLELIVKEILQT